MYITVAGQTFDCTLGDDGTLDTLVYIDGMEHTVSQEAAAEYRTKDGGFTRAGFKRMCTWIIEEEC